MFTGKDNLAFENETENKSKGKGKGKKSAKKSLLIDDYENIDKYVCFWSFLKIFLVVLIQGTINKES